MTGFFPLIISNDRFVHTDYQQRRICSHWLSAKAALFTLIISKDKLFTPLTSNDRFVHTDYQQRQICTLWLSAKTDSLTLIISNDRFANTAYQPWQVSSLWLSAMTDLFTLIISKDRFDHSDYQQGLLTRIISNDRFVHTDYQQREICSHWLSAKTDLFTLPIRNDRCENNAIIFFHTAYHKLQTSRHCFSAMIDLVKNAYQQWQMSWQYLSAMTALFTSPISKDRFIYRAYQQWQICLHLLSAMTNLFAFVISNGRFVHTTYQKLEQVSGGAQIPTAGAITYISKQFKSATLTFMIRNIAKSLFHELSCHWPTYTLWGQSLCFLISYVLYNSHESNSLQDIKQNPWTAKYRSLTYIYFPRSIFVSRWSIIPSMTFLHQIVLKVLSNITRPQNLGRWLTYMLWRQSLCHTDPLS